MTRLVAAHLIAALLFLMVGIGMGIYMAISHDFTLSPVHAHVNLLGWVTNALIATIFWHARDGTVRLGWTIFACFNLGVLLKNFGLGALLLGSKMPLFLLAGVLLISVGVLLFAAFVIREAAGRRLA
jgi:hypothetical protein